jgi:hypothetical protein
MSVIPGTRPIRNRAEMATVGQYAAGAPIDSLLAEWRGTRAELAGLLADVANFDRYHARIVVQEVVTRTHVRTLRDLGWTYRQITHAARVPKGLPLKLDVGAITRLTPEWVAAILAVPLMPCAKRTTREPSPVDAARRQRTFDSVGMRRRVQALARMGWPSTEIAARCGVTRSTLQMRIRQSSRVSYALVQRVAALYEELSETRGPSKATAAKARQVGHAPPAAWDKCTIDDPGAEPKSLSQDAHDKRQVLRAVCPICRRGTALVTDGLIRYHLGRYRRPCPGSGRPPKECHECGEPLVELRGGRRRCPDTTAVGRHRRQPAGSLHSSAGGQ